MNEPLLRVSDLEERWKCSAATIYGLRYKRKGPPALFVGRELRWRLTDVEVWEEAQLEERSRAS